MPSFTRKIQRRPMLVVLFAPEVDISPYVQHHRNDIRVTVCRCNVQGCRTPGIDSRAGGFIGDEDACEGGEASYGDAVKSGEISSRTEGVVGVNPEVDGVDADGDCACEEVGAVVCDSPLEDAVCVFDGGYVRGEERGEKGVEVVGGAAEGGEAREGEVGGDGEEKLVGEGGE